jgi:hypothetical protein
MLLLATPDYSTLLYSTLRCSTLFFKNKIEHF